MAVHIGNLEVKIFGVYYPEVREDCRSSYIGLVAEHLSVPKLTKRMLPRGYTHGESEAFTDAYRQ
ncbi:MAG: hypothetical protein AAF400_01430 [Bacteroidota bacterium]